MTVRFLRAPRLATAGALAVAAMLLGAGTALAHVTVSPGSVTPGSYSTITFRVPTESDTASTTKIEISIPADTPIPTVLAQHDSGWTAEVDETTLPAPVTQGAITLTKAVSSVSFTARDSGIPPHQFATFSLVIGPVPDVDSITFDVTQTYSDSTVVQWNEPTPAGGAEPEHPAPVLAIGDAAAGDADADHDHASVSAGTPASTSADTGQAAAHTDSGSSNGLAITLAVIGLVLGLAAVALALVALRRRPPGTTPPAST